MCSPRPTRCGWSAGRWPSARSSNRRSVAGIHPVGHRGRRRSLCGDNGSRSRADLDEVAHRHLLTRDEGRAGGRRPSAMRAVGAPRGRTSPTCATPAASSNTARWPSPRSAAGAPIEDLIANTPADGMVTGIGQHRRDRSASGRAAVDVLRLHRARRHAGHAQPREDRPRVRAGRAANGCRWCCSPKAAAAGPATPTSAGVAGLRRAHLRELRRPVRPGAAGRHRRPAAASPATPRCSAAAT